MYNYNKLKEQILSLIPENLTMKEMRIRLNISQYTLLNIIKKFNLHQIIKIKGAKNASNEEIDLLKKMINEGRNLTEVARALKRNRQVIVQMCALYDINHIFKNAVIRTLSDKEEEIALKMFKEGETLADISKVLKCDATFLSKTLKKWGFIKHRTMITELNLKLNKENKRFCPVCKSVKDICFFHKNKPSKCKSCWSNYHIEKEKLMRINKDARLILARRLCACKTRSKQLEMKFNLDLEFMINLLEKQKGLCFYSGKTLSMSTDQLETLSIDRVDSSKGYTKDNVVLCCTIVNRMKLDFTQKDFKQYIKDMYNHFVISS